MDPLGNSRLAAVAGDEPLGAQAVLAVHCHEHGRKYRSCGSKRGCGDCQQDDDDLESRSLQRPEISLAAAHCLISVSQRWVIVRPTQQMQVQTMLQQ